MPETLLRTKLFIPPVRPNLVLRHQLIERLNQGLKLGHKITLVSAPAGFGKTTLVSEWLAGRERPIAWLSLDEGDNDPARFLAYFIAALQTVVPNIGEGVLAVLQSPQPAPTELILTALLNEISTVPDNFILVLDDYHVIDAQSIDNALTFLLEHLPPNMHLVIATLEDPDLPLARLRGRGQSTELRVADLRFTFSEAAEFLNQVMGLDLAPDDIVALETRTEGWIAGLHMASLSMHGQADTTAFIKSFTGSHHFVLDYLVEEVLHQQSESVQTFLLKTAVLDRLTGSLCDAITGKDNGRQTLEYLEQANLFIVPLDNERRWYRYHHLFADLLRQRLQQSAAKSMEDEAELHMRASVWYEENGLEIEAFHHATTANDVERAERLIEGDGLPLHWHGAAAPVLNWLASLPTTVLDTRPSLWVTYASALIFAGQTSSIEQKLQAAEAALQGAEADDKTQDLVGHIAAIRGMMAVSQHQIETIIAQSSRALQLLHSDNLPVRTAALWTLGYAYELQGDRAAATRAYAEVIANSQASGNFMFTIAATTSLGNIQEAENQLYLAAETHQHALQLAGDPPLPFACASYIGLARVLYQWNDLENAEKYGQLSAQLAQQIEGVDTPAICNVLLARLKLARGDVAGASALLTEAEQFVRQHNFMFRMPDVAAAQVLTSLHQGDLAGAAFLADKHDLPISQARVHLAQGDTNLALALLEPLRKQAETKGWADERLKVLVLQSVAYHAHGDNDQAVQLLRDALVQAEPSGFIRIFVDEGPPMAHLLYEALTRGIAPEYAQKLLAAFPIAEQGYPAPSKTQSAIIEPLSQRELEVLELIAQGLSNREISERLFLALSTVKRHNGNIFGKLEVRRRTEAVARARELGLL